MVGPRVRLGVRTPMKVGRACPHRTRRAEGVAGNGSMPLPEGISGSGMNWVGDWHAWKSEINYYVAIRDRSVAVGEAIRREAIGDSFQCDGIRHKTWLPDFARWNALADCVLGLRQSRGGSQSEQGSPSDVGCIKSLISSELH